MRFSGQGFDLIGLPKLLFVRHLQQRSVSQGPTAEMRGSRLAIRILEYPRPGQPGLRGRLIDREQYRRSMKSLLLAAAEAHARAGEGGEAREFARRERALGRTGPIQDFAAFVMSYAPELVVWFTRSVWVPPDGSRSTPGQARGATDRAAGDRSGVADAHRPVGGGIERMMTTSPPGGEVASAVYDNH